MFRRTKSYNAGNTRRLADQIKLRGLFGDPLLFPEVLYAFHDLSDKGLKPQFQQVVDAILDYAVRKNSSYDSRSVRYR